MLTVERSVARDLPNGFRLRAHALLTQVLEAICEHSEREGDALLRHCRCRAGVPFSMGQT